MIQKMKKGDSRTLFVFRKALHEVKASIPEADSEGGVGGTRPPYFLQSLVFFKSL